MNFHVKPNNYYKTGGTVRVNQIGAGDTVYSVGLKGLFRLDGFTGPEPPTGPGEVKFYNIKEVYKAFGVRGPRELQVVQDEETPGRQSYMIGQLCLENGERVTVRAYLNNGRWSVGPKAVRLEMVEYEKMTPEEIHEYRIKYDRLYRQYVIEDFQAQVKQAFPELQYTKDRFGDLEYTIPERVQIDKDDLMDTVREIAECCSMPWMTIYEK